MKKLFGRAKEKPTGTNCKNRFVDQQIIECPVAYGHHSSEEHEKRHHKAVQLDLTNDHPLREEP